MNEDKTLNDQLHWYKDAVIYELHIKAFCDGNEDGIGDMDGLIKKLDHLVELGVTAIWLLPFYPSPLRDDGYDISDYFNINPSFGNISQFKKLLKEAHKRNLKIITELVLNHTSDQHPWFQRARNSPRNSPKRNYYVWTDDTGKYQDARIIFQDFETSNWSWDEKAQQYYWHRFFHHQPDLNFDSTEVQEEIIAVLDFWCKMGVDGFRLDAVPYLYEREGTNCENLPETHVFLKRIRNHIDQHFPGTLLLAEANMWPEDAAAYFGNGDECQMNYHFPVMPRMFMAIQMEDRYAITDIFDQTPAIPETCQWAIFLRNHDELTLEMVTDEERDYMYKTYVRDQKARINLGIRHRLAPLMENDRRKIELMNSLLFTLPGTPVIYYGDEIGMGDNYYLGDRDGVRTPMQWSSDRNAGFSGANPQHLYLPVIQDAPYHYETVNVETQRSNTSSLYWHMKRIISARKKFKAFGRGDIRFLSVENPKVLAFTRNYLNETILVIANLSKFSQPSEVALDEYAGLIPNEIFSNNNFPVIKEKIPYFFTLSPYGFQWFILKKEPSAQVGQGVLPVLELNEWSDLLETRNRKILEKNIIPSYLSRINWFSGDQGVFYDCSIKNHHTISMGNNVVYMTLLQVNYKSGLPDNYHLPLVILKSPLIKNILTEHPESILAEIKTADGPGVLCDALFTEEMQLWFFEEMTRAKKRSKSKSPIVFKGDEHVSDYRQKTKTISSRLHFSAYQSNTAITYNNRFFLKIYRKVEPGLHPDLEISRFLTEETQFKNSPAYLGSAEINTSRDSYPLAMLQVMVENHGTGYSYMQERVHNYIERVISLKKKTVLPDDFPSSLANPQGFEDNNSELKILLGAGAAFQSAEMGKRIAELHLSLSTGTSKDFVPEKFSLHYQHSLYSAIQSPFRGAFQELQKNMHNLPGRYQADAEYILDRKKELNEKLKRIYEQKIDTMKIRIHGNLNLPQILLSGKDIFIHDFGGDPGRSLSERRIKRSCLRDVASMVRSFYYTSYEPFIDHAVSPGGEIVQLMPYAQLWAHHISGYFVKSYLEKLAASPLVPKQKDHLQILLETYLLEKSFYSLIDELQHRTAYAIIPLKIIRSLLD